MKYFLRQMEKNTTKLVERVQHKFLRNTELENTTQISLADETDGEEFFTAAQQ
jgi:hypothetical protein